MCFKRRTEIAEAEVLTDEELYKLAHPEKPNTPHLLTDKYVEHLEEIKKIRQRNREIQENNDRT